MEGSFTDDNSTDTCSLHFGYCELLSQLLSVVKEVSLMRLTAMLI